VDAIVTLDAGTGSGRCVVFDPQGRVLAKSQESFVYRTFTDPDLPMLRGFDLDADRFWAALARCAGEAIGALPPGTRIRGVIATSQREGCVFLDRAGSVLYAGPNLDARAAIEGMEAQNAFGPGRLHAITGHAPPYIFPLARYLWFRKHHDASQVASLLMLNDWIGYQLCGARVVEESNACESMLFDVTARAWSDEILDALDVPRAILPPVCAAGTRSARERGGRRGDGHPGGRAGLRGRSRHGERAPRRRRPRRRRDRRDPRHDGARSARHRPRVIDPGGNLWTSCHVAGGRWVLESNGGDTGGTYRWLLDLLYGGTDAAAHAQAEGGGRVGGGRRTPPRRAHRAGDLQPAEMNPFQPAGIMFPFPLLHLDRPTRATSCAASSRTSRSRSAATASRSRR
jgi:sugar (pentulose or hexulose) kinase